ncbi:nitrite reductase small subunit NirD [Thiohalorhabdus methylotrophus]|uniref:Nitrite reductase small subunit NirD n=1 Tax=Thiohalorhabdus methylotrophus TaxID=3242694 RepID=A0ABV4TVU4_9GAMM
MSESQWMEIGALADIPPRGARVVRTELGDIAVFRAADDAVFALDDRCPHQGGPLSQGMVLGHRVACPLHNWQIELGSGEAVAPDEGCTRRHPVRVEDGRVYLAPDTGGAAEAARSVETES